MAATMTGPDAGLGRDMAASTEWIHPLSARAADELDAALRGVQGLGLAWPKFGRDQFPLPTLSRELAAMLDELEHGRGFALLRGLPVDRYGDEELKTLYWGLGCHLGWPRYQNATGELIGEVRDENRRYGLVREPTMDLTLGRSSRSKAQDEALDLHAVLCEELCFTMDFEPGDVQLLNNHVIYHGCTHYEDADGPEQDRLLLRLWLATPNSRALPASYLPIWGSTEPGVPRDGIAQPA